MKKWFKLFAALCLAAVLCVPLAACEWGSESGGPENGGSENGGNSGDPSAVRTTVTEEEWNAAVYGDLVYSGIDGFLYDPEANVTMVSTSTTALNAVEGKINIEVQIDGNKWYVKFSDETTFGAESEKLTAEGYLEILDRSNDEGPVMANVYSKDENGQWTVAEDEFSLETDGEIDFVNEDVKKVYAYENFTYNASLRRYEAKDLEFDLGEEFGMSLTIDVMAVQFENGKLVHCEAKIESETNGIEISVYAVWQYENGRVVRGEQQVEQKTDEGLFAAKVSATYSYGTASVTLPVVGE